MLKNKTQKNKPQNPPDLRANQVIQESGAGKQQKAPNSNRLAWESLY